MKKPLEKGAIKVMEFLMCDTTINNKVMSSGEEGVSYSRFDIRDNGVVVLGETKSRFWNQLIGCQCKLPFEKWALAVWDALVDLSVGGNAKAIEEGLSAEIAKKAQRSENYEWVVKRLYDCYAHVCNNKGENMPSEGGRDVKGSDVNLREVYVNGEPITININASNFNKRLRIPDATGRHYLNFGLGVVDVKVDHD